MSAVPISGTKELASHTPIIVWHTRSDTFVLIPQLELTRAVAQTVPVFFLTLLLFAVIRAGGPRPYIDAIQLQKVMLKRNPSPFEQQRVSVPIEE